MILTVVLAGCSDSKVTIGELDDLEGGPGVEVRVGSEIHSVGGRDARIGVASGRGERVPFAVVIGDESPRAVSINGRSYRLSSGCAGAGFYTQTEAFSAVGSQVETAVYDQLAADAYCEG